jgi:hypothetical protein|nr:hypothetical protein [Neorhizobium tomejilense]
MEYFRNDAEAVTVSGFSFENGVGSVSFHGSAVFSTDETSLQALRALSARLSEMENALVVAIGEGVTGSEAAVALEIVENPFA